MFCMIVAYGLSWAKEMKRFGILIDDKVCLLKFCTQVFLVLWSIVF